MLTLAIETSGLGGSIALLDGQQLLGERLLNAERRHAQTLVPEIQSLLREHGQRPAECELIAVSVGPGSFTGLRVGITCAKTMAYVTKAKLAAVPTFDCLAAGCPDDVNNVQVIMNAQRQELFIGRYQRGADGAWNELRRLVIERSMEWQAQLQSGDVVTGPGLDGISADLSSRCRVLDKSLWQPQARWVGVLGQRINQTGGNTSCWDLLPLYVRKSAAEEKWDAQHPGDAVDARPRH